jgi:hypothetical protein
VRYYDRDKKASEDEYAIGIELDAPLGNHAGDGYFVCKERHGITVKANAVFPIYQRGLCEARLPKSQMIVTGSNSPNPIDLWWEMFPHGDNENREISELEDAEFAAQPAEARLVLLRNAAGQLHDFTIDDKVYTSMLDAFIRTNKVALFGNPSVRAVIKYKWHSFAKNLFLIEFSFYIVALVLLTSLAFIPKINQTSTYGCYVCLCIELFLQVRNEWCQVRYAWSVGELAVYYLDPWNIFQLSIVGTTAGVIISGGLGASEAVPFLALAIYLKWIGIFYFMQGFQTSGKFELNFCHRGGESCIHTEQKLIQSISLHAYFLISLFRRLHSYYYSNHFRHVHFHASAWDHRFGHWFLSLRSRVI